MTSENIFRAMREIDVQFILDAAPDAPRKRTISWQKWITIAACFCILIVGAVGYYNVVLRGANATGPEIFTHTTLEAMNTEIGKNTLYNDTTIDFSEENGRISVSYYADDEGNIDFHDPNQLKITVNEGSVRVDYYILFGRDNVKKSYIGGYEEQKLRVEINGITVHYSKVFDGSYHSQAKFIYDGDLYVIDVTSREDNHDILDYINRILKEE